MATLSVSYAVGTQFVVYTPARYAGDIPCFYGPFPTHDSALQFAADMFDEDREFTVRYMIDPATV